MFSRINCLSSLAVIWKVTNKSALVSDLMLIDQAVLDWLAEAWSVKSATCRHRFSINCNFFSSKSARTHPKLQMWLWSPLHWNQQKVLLTSSYFHFASSNTQAVQVGCVLTVFPFKINWRTDDTSVYKPLVGPRLSSNEWKMGELLCKNHVDPS